MSEISITDAIVIPAGSGDETQGRIPDYARDQPRNIRIEGFSGNSGLSSTQQSAKPPGKVWLVFHGWNGSYADFRAMARLIAATNPDDTVLAIDWTEASGGVGLRRLDDEENTNVGDPFNGGHLYAASWIAPVAEAIYSRLLEWGVASGAEVNLVGHSLGSLMSAQIAGHFVDAGLGLANSITALDPPSENRPPGAWGFGTPERYRNGYNLDIRRDDADQVPLRPREFNQVAVSSRAFVGSRSIGGNRQFALWSNEPILVDFGGSPISPLDLSSSVRGIGREHGDVYRNFRSLIDPNVRQLARGLFSFEDQEDHQQFGLLQELDQTGRRGFRGFLGSRFGERNNAVGQPDDRFAEPLFFLAPRIPTALGQEFSPAEASAINATTYVVYATTETDVLRVTPATEGINQGTPDIAIFNNRNLDTLNSRETMAPFMVNQSVLYYLGKGNDTLIAGSRNDVAYGDEGVDELDGVKGDDVLSGGADNDTLRGGEGHDRLIGGSGDDILLGAIGEDTIYGDEGIDKLDGAKGDDVLSGGADNDTLQGGEGHDRFFGGSGDDTIVGGKGEDTIYGDDAPELTGDRGSTLLYDDTINAGEDLDIVYGGWGKDIIRGGTGGDTLCGGDDLDNIYGEEDNDIINGDGGDDRLFGGDGEDQISGGADHDHVDGGVASDQLKGNDGNDFLTGAMGNDTLIGGSGIDRLYGGDGFDNLYGDDTALTAPIPNILYNDIMNGGAGIDQIQGGWGIDRIWGGSNNDTIYGDWQDVALPPKSIASDDTIYGDNGRDTIQGGWGKDTIWGGDDTDILYGNDGNDEIHGGANTPLPGAPPVIIIGTGYGVSLPDEFELLDGGKGNDELYGDSGVDHLYGREDNDFLYGGEDDDQLWGNSGHDELNGGEGNDKLYGGQNRDTLRGDSGDDRLEGGAGNDQIYGESGDDVIYGGMGNDEIKGGGGIDWISGVDDTTSAGAGAYEIDRLSGGGGKDTFILGDANAVFYHSAGLFDYALIADFNAQQDKIQLKGKAEDYLINRTEGRTEIYKSKTLDLVFLSDRSGSFQSEAASERQFAQELLDQLQQQRLDIAYGVTSFVDIPAYPLGLNQVTGSYFTEDIVEPGHYESVNGPAYYSYWVPGYTIPGEEVFYTEETGNSYTYFQDLPLTDDPDEVASKLASPEFFTQADAPEAQLLALQSLAEDSSLGFRTGSARVVVMVTDSPYHVAGDVSAAGVNLNYDYPDIDQLRSALRQSNIMPLFVVTSDVLSNYRSLAQQLGFDDRIVFDLGSVASNPDRVTEQIASASIDLIGAVETDARLNLSGSYFNYV
jgi:Ca2+-binding RTX toxin-like protein